MIRKKNPYESIPSLYDMYVQAVPRPVSPRRFGADVFENATRDSQLIPMDLPAGPDYVVDLGPGAGEEDLGVAGQLQDLLSPERLANLSK